VAPSWLAASAPVCLWLLSVSYPSLSDWKKGKESRQTEQATSADMFKGIMQYNLDAIFFFAVKQIDNPLWLLTFKNCLHNAMGYYSAVPQSDY
jgi:hypothetical protein